MSLDWWNPKYFGYSDDDNWECVSSTNPNSGTVTLSKVSTKTYDIKRVIFSNPATIVIWKDGTKTVVKCYEGDTYDALKGVALCYMKKVCGSKFHKIMKESLKEIEEETK